MPPESLTLTITARVRQLMAEGRTVYRFNIGEPDFPTPDHIKAAGNRAIAENFTKYTAGGGIPELREAVARDLNRRYESHVEPGQVVITIGGKFALSTAIMALVDRGDDVLIPSPCFLSYPDMVRLAGGNPVMIPVTREENFLPDPEVIHRAITPSTRLIILNTPHNPSGVVYPEHLLKQLVEVTAGKEIMILSDEVYEQLVFDGARHTTLAADQSVQDRLVMVNSFSKTYCMTGWRLGYLIAPTELAKAVTHIQSHMASSPCAISQKAALEALEGPQDTVLHMLHVFEDRRDLICRLLDDIPDLPYVRPSGTFYVFPEVSGYYGSRIKNSLDMSIYLLESRGVATVPGSVFGDDRHIRLAFATSEDEIRSGLGELKKALADLKN